MSKHTPGPWIQVGDTVGVPVGRVAWVFAPTSSTWTEEIANARLIAAAPDLLEALRGLLEVTDFYELYGAKTEAARAAIAKVEGKQ